MAPSQRLIELVAHPSWPLASSCYPVNPESLSLNHLTYFPTSSNNYPPDQTLQTSLSLTCLGPRILLPDVLLQQAQPHLTGSGGFVPSSDAERSSHTSSWKPSAWEGSAVQLQGGCLVLNLRFVMSGGVTHPSGNPRNSRNLLLKEKDMHTVFRGSLPSLKILK